MFDPADHPDLLAGLDSPDDAAVLRLDEDRALIFTTDFFTPIVDDPFSYGAIAAANALSDVYAMGGKPVLALNIAAFPDNLPISILGDILRGMAEKVREAGAVIAGGHTIKDKEPKVGLAVIGMARPDRLLAKRGARPGDLLIITKPLGTGTIATAGKNDQADPAHIDEAIRWMSLLNRDAAAAALAAGARAVTDITGFGLIGHATEMTAGGDVTFQFEASKIPLLSGVEGYAARWIFPAGSLDNRKMYAPKVRFEAGLSEEKQIILFDAQTSGGLLIALPPEGQGAFRVEMAKTGAAWQPIGVVATRGEFDIEVAK